MQREYYQNSEINKSREVRYSRKYEENDELDA